MELPAKTRADLGWDILLDHLAARTRSIRGARLARALAPLPDLDSARARHEEVNEARALRDTGDGLPLDGVRDLDDALGRAGKGGALDPQVLRDVASTLTTGARVRHHLIERGTRAARLLGRAALIADLDEVSGPIDDAFDSGEAGSAPRLSDRASPALGGLRRKAQKVREELERKVGTLLDAGHVAPHLQDRFATQRDDRYVIPVRVDARAKVRGIVHGTSQSGQTVFVEPEEIVELNNRLKLAELEVAEEERRILAELSRLVEEALPRIQVNLEVLAGLDLLDAAARLSLDLRATAPELTEGGAIDLRRARHPLMVLAGRACVPNDLLLGFGQTLVVSGPNAGGKTVALKTAGLAALMARSGLHVAAQEGSRIPLLSAVLSDVGDDQSLERNLSTFSAHVAHLREFLAAARPGTLVLLDEIAVGTDPTEGAALAQAVLEELAARGATTVVTTHYDRLKVMAARDPRFVNASVGFDVESLQPTYELHLGVPGASGAIVVAKRLGLDAPICARARGLANENQSGLEELLHSLQQERKRAQRSVEEAEVERTRAAEARALAEREAQLAKEQLIKARKGAHDDAIDTLQRARAELDRSRSVLKRRGGQVTPAEMVQVRQTIDAAAQKVREAAPAPEPPPGRPAEAGELTSSREVWVQRIGGRAQVLQAPKGGKVMVQAGPLKLTVPVDEVRIVEGSKTPASARSRRGHLPPRSSEGGKPPAFDDAAPALGGQAKSRGRFPSIDVRGERVDAALGLTEKFLDDAIRGGQEGVLVIHGHGTGALRDRLRAHFSALPFVSEVRPGEPDEGGDGVTVVALG